MSDIEDLLAANDPMSTPVMALDSTPLTKLPHRRPPLQHAEDASDEVARLLPPAQEEEVAMYGSQQHIVNNILGRGGGDGAKKRSRATASAIGSLLENFTHDVQLQHIILLCGIAILVLIPYVQRTIQNAVPVLKTSSTIMVLINAIAISVGYYYSTRLLQP